MIDSGSLSVRHLVSERQLVLLPSGPCTFRQRRPIVRHMMEGIDTDNAIKACISEWQTHAVLLQSGTLAVTSRIQRDRSRPIASTSGRVEGDRHISEAIEQFRDIQEPAPSLHFIPRS